MFLLCVLLKESRGEEITHSGITEASTAVMSNECFFCFGTTDERATDERDGNVSMPCCNQVVHRGCHDRWMVDYDYCGYCRTQVRGLEPLTQLDFHRLMLYKDLLLLSPFYSRVEVTVMATVVDAGLLVDDKEIISELQEYLGDFDYTIDRKGPNSGGFQSGRLVHITFKTPNRDFLVHLEQTPKE